MTLAAGDSLSFYEILAPLGKGGMGEVYRARDTRLDREVAIKVLPDEFVEDDDRLRRFEREAKLLASLTHANVAAIYGIDQVENTCFLALELVKGEDLAVRLQRGKLTVVEALKLCRQIADGLEAAHETGVIHRDLKPANVCLTDDGVVKLLDFGLAKSLGADPTSSTGTSVQSDSFELTRDGVVLGTPTYMSPEQARGRKIDRRTDVWAFGCVLYECLTGTRPFGGESMTDVLGAILHLEPDWTALPPDVGPRVRRLLRRCLDKDPRQRLRDIGDARLELERVLVVGDAEAVPASVAAAPPQRFLAWSGWALAALAIAVAGRELLGGKAPAPAPVTRFTIHEPLLAVGMGDFDLSQLAISRDGSTIVYTALGDDGLRRLFLRTLDSLETRVLEGTEGAYGPFFSPDGEWVGFATAVGQLRKTSIRGGAPVRLASAQAVSRGAAWGEDGTLWFTAGPNVGLSRIFGGNGPPENVTTPRSDRRERTHRWPKVLPGDRGVLFTIGDGDIRTFDEAKVAVLDLRSGEERVLVEGASYGLYSPTGHLLYTRGGTVAAVPFDLETLQVTGPAVTVLSGVVTRPFSGAAEIALAADGTLAYAAGEPFMPEDRLMWFDRTGEKTPASELREPYMTIDLSPDGHTVVTDIDGANSTLWLHDLNRDALTVVASDWVSNGPKWSSSGEQLVFQRPMRAGSSGLFVVEPRNGMDAKLVFESSATILVSSWSPDDEWFACTLLDEFEAANIHVLRADGRGETVPFQATSSNEGGGMFSPDGHWMAYGSDESGRGEVYVAPYPGPGRKVRISSEGGHSPRWSALGDELFFVNGNSLMAVTVTVEPDFEAGRPVELFEADFSDSYGMSYAVAPDAQRFLVVEELRNGSEVPVVVVRNWTTELLELLEE